MAHRVILPRDLDWAERPHEPDEAARYVAPLSELAGFAGSRANVWRFEPGASGKRHRHALQEETFVVLSGTLSIYLGDPPERIDVPARGIVHIEAGTVVQSANHGDEELLVYVYGTPPEHEQGAIYDSAV